MANLLQITTPSTRPRAVSNGGLGGFVELNQLVDQAEYTSKYSWPKKRKKNPPPIQIVPYGSFTFSTTTSTSIAWRSPERSPSASLLSPIALTSELPSPPVSRFNAKHRSCIHPQSPQTPVTPCHRTFTEPLELAGSLLQPAQGFPIQSVPPVTPTKPILKLRTSEDSVTTLESVPGLSTSSTLADIDMNHFKWSPKKKAARLVGSPTLDGATPTVGQPFSAMSAEDLLQALPDCNPEMIRSTWIPAMLREHAKFKRLLQEAANHNLQSHFELKSFGQDLSDISQDTRKISNTYEHALRRAESLSERDLKIRQRRYQSIEEDLCNALAALEGQRDIIGEKEAIITSLRETINYIIFNLEEVIGKTTPLLVQALGEQRIGEVIDMLSDHAQTDTIVDSYLRISEETFQNCIGELRAAKKGVQEFRQLAKSQHELIQLHSSDLDRNTQKHAQLLQMINQKNHELQLLSAKVEEQAELINQYASGQKTSHSVQVEHEELTKQCEDVEAAMQTMTSDHRKDIDHRDAEIANLRQKLGNAWEQVIVGKTDVKNVISQTQALLAPPEMQRNGPDSLSGKERRMLAKKSNMSCIPSSKSMLSLSSCDATDLINLGSPSAINFKARMEPRSPRVGDQGQWTCGMPRKRSVPDLRADKLDFPDTRPARKDSLGGRRGGRPSDLHLLQSVVKGSVSSRSSTTPTPSINIDKALPTPPHVHESVHDLDSISDSVTGSVLHDFTHVPKPTEHTTPTGLGKRILSGIPEISSAEDPDSPPHSATSSDREVFRQSVAALSLIDMLRESDMRLTPSPRRFGRAQRSGFEGLSLGTLSPVGNGGGYGPVEVGTAQTVRIGGQQGARKEQEVTDDESPPKTVAEMYHGGMRGGGGMK